MSKLWYFWSFMLGAFVGAAALAAWQVPTNVVETPAAAQTQPDGSLVLERMPDSKAKPENAIPEGGKAVRVVHGEIKPKEPDCPICTFDLTLVRMPDNTSRVVLSSQTGTILGGLDVPVATLKIDKDHPWAAGISRGTGFESWGAWLDRDFGPVRFGGEANKNGDGQYEARIKLGLRF
jgi:hypothetical protein